jgi:HSP20 family protein
MANLIRRDNREVARGRETGTAREWDPFRMMEALLRWDPMRSEGGSGFLSEAADFAPRLDVKETKDAYLLKADLPGMTDKDVEVTVTGNVLTIAGQREEERREEGDRYYATERSYGRFARSLSLPDGADLDNLKAELKEGVLTLQIPKRPEVQPKRITIGTSGGGEASKAKA